MSNPLKGGLGIWKSSHLKPCLLNGPFKGDELLKNDLPNLNEENCAQIPESGWHGLFFAVKEADEDRNHRREAKAGYSQSKDSQEFRLSLWISESSEGSSPTLLNLKLLRDPKNNIAWQAGRLHYFPAGSRVAVIRHNCSEEETTRRVGGRGAAPAMVAPSKDANKKTPTADSKVTLHV